MSMQVNIYKKDLTEREEAYINERSALRQARDEAIAHDRLEEMEAHAESEAAAQGSEEEGVPVEEWVALPEVTKDDIKKELDAREVAYDPKATKPELAKLLVNSVTADR